MGDFKNFKHSFSWVILIVIIAHICLFVAPVKAKDKYWKQGGVGDWDDPDRWENNNPPDQGDDIHLTTSGVCFYNKPSADLASLRIDAFENDTVMRLDQGSVGLNAFREYVGIHHNGTHLLSEGTVSIAILDMGLNPESKGVYGISDNAYLRVDRDVILANQGSGLITNSGGRNQINGRLYLGYGEDGHGEYKLFRGAYLWASEQNIGKRGHGEFKQYGGTNIAYLKMIVGDYPQSTGNYMLLRGELNAKNEYIGERGSGTFNHVHGTNRVLENLYLGYMGGTGIYDLTSDGHLSAQQLYVGYNSIGQFKQDGGTITLDQGLHIGSQTGSMGTYQMSDGRLNARTIQVADNGGGEFIYQGGDIDTHRFIVSDGGKLLLQNDMTLHGELIVRGGSVEGKQTLIIDGPDEYAQINFGQGAMNLDRLEIGEHYAGRLYQHLFAVSEIGELSLAGQPGSNAEVEFYGDRMDVGFLGLGIPNGTGTFMHQRGELSVHLFGIGDREGGTGEYTFRGGTAVIETLGLGNGWVDQILTAQMTVNDLLWVGGMNDDAPRYTLRGDAVLKVGELKIGTYGNGVFNQSGGHHTGWPLNNSKSTIGVYPNHRGDYNLYSGILESWEFIIGSEGIGIMNHRGGEHVADHIRVGVDDGQGTYKLGQEAILQVREFDIGPSGIGTLDIYHKDAQINIQESLHLNNNAFLTAVPGSQIRMNGMAHFFNSSTDAQALSGMNHLTLVFPPNSNVYGPRFLEIGCLDRGAQATGFNGNFALDTLEIGGDPNHRTIVNLVDNVKNFPDSDLMSEVLYVKNLIIHPGGMMNLSHYKVYCLRLENNNGIFMNGEPQVVPSFNPDPNWIYK